MRETEAALAADQSGRPFTCAPFRVWPTGPNWWPPAAARLAGRPFGAYLASGDPAAIAAVAEGRAGVQDEASQLAAIALSQGRAGRRR